MTSRVLIAPTEGPRRQPGRIQERPTAPRSATTSCACPASGAAPMYFELDDERSHTPVMNRPAPSAGTPPPRKSRDDPAVTQLCCPGCRLRFTPAAAASVIACPQCGGLPQPIASLGRSLGFRLVDQRTSCTNSPTQPSSRAHLPGRAARDHDRPPRAHPAANGPTTPASAAQLRRR